MITSKYFPTVEAYTNQSPSGEDKIEIPADVYDIAVSEGKIAAGNFIRGDYDYETAKIFAQSGRIDALKFDAMSSEIKTTSTVGISTEINFAIAIWNSYSREAAIERAILSGLKNSDMPKLLAEKVSQVNISDSSDLEEDFAKYLAGKSFGYINNKLEASRALAVSAEVPINVSRVPQFFHNVGDKVGDLFSSLSDEIILVFRYGKNFWDLKTGRISGKQFGKNTAVTAVGVTGAGVGWAWGSAIAATAGLPAILTVGTALVGGYAFKMFYKKVMKTHLDRFISEDSEDMQEIFIDELVKMLDGKFLTQYEMELLLEAIRNTVTEEKLKDMYQRGNLLKRTKWAHDFIERELQDVEGQRLLVIMPTSAEWQAGLERVAELLNSGEDINARMEQQRVQTLTQRRKFLAEKYDLKPYETAQAMSIINPLLKTQIEIDRTLASIQQNETYYQSERQQLMNERTLLKAKLNRRR